MTTLRPVVSEKSFDGGKTGLYTFRVLSTATKPEIAKAVEQQFGVTVVKVRTLQRPSKERRNPRKRGVVGIRPGFKKAMVQLKKGDSIKELQG
jgi:large subunit ribosomal protein L23